MSVMPQRDEIPPGTLYLLILKTLARGGELHGYEIECPRHGARFDLRTGAARCPPAYEPTAVFPVKVEDGAIFTRDDRWD